MLCCKCRHQLYTTPPYFTQDWLNEHEREQVRTLIRKDLAHLMQSSMRASTRRATIVSSTWAPRAASPRCTRTRSAGDLNTRRRERRDDLANRMSNTDFL